MKRLLALLLSLYVLTGAAWGQWEVLEYPRYTNPLFISDDGEVLLYAPDTMQLIRWSTDGTEEVLQNGIKDNPQCSPDGRRILARMEDGYWYVFSTDGQQAIRTPLSGPPHLRWASMSNAERFSHSSWEEGLWRPEFSTTSSSEPAIAEVFTRKFFTQKSTLAAGISPAGDTLLLYIPEERLFKKATLDGAVKATYEVPGEFSFLFWTLLSKWSDDGSTTLVQRAVGNEKLPLLLVENEVIELPKPSFFESIHMTSLSGDGNVVAGWGVGLSEVGLFPKNYLWSPNFNVQTFKVAEHWEGVVSISQSGNVMTGVSIDPLTMRHFIWRGSPDPAVTINELIALVEEFNLQNGISNSLDTKKLQSARRAASAKKHKNAIGKLEAFADEVRKAQRDDALTDEQATEWIQTANFAIYWLEKNPKFCAKR